MKIVKPNPEGRFYHFNKTVAIVAPSYSMSRLTLSRAIKRLTALGFTIYYEKLPKLLKWSGTFSERGIQLSNYFKNSDVDIVWALRGGMASSAIIPYIDFESISKNKKLFIGYSDITSLQLALYKFSNLSSYQFYMPGALTWMNTGEDFDFLTKILQEEDYSTTINDNQIRRSGLADSEIVGGCLDLICSSLGTPYELDTNGKILFLEDVRISPERYVNELNHLKLAGKFDNIKGLIVGKIVSCKNNLDYLEVFLNDINLSVPIVIEFDSGHTLKKIPVPLGSRCKLDTFGKTISFEAIKFN